MKASGPLSGDCFANCCSQGQEQTVRLNRGAPLENTTILRVSELLQVSTVKNSELETSAMDLLNIQYNAAAVALKDRMPHMLYRTVWRL